MENRRSLHLEMMSRVASLVVYFWGTMFAFVAVVITHWLSLDSLWKSVLLPGLVLTVVAAAFWGAMFFLVRFMKRALFFYAYLTLGSIAFSAVVLAEIAWLATVKLGGLGWWVIGLVIIWLLVGFYQSYTGELRTLNRQEEATTKNRQFDREMGTWDLSIDRVGERKKGLSWSKIWWEIVLGVIGLALFLLLGGRLGSPSIMGVVLVLILGLMLFGVGDYLAYTALLWSWENDMGKKIMLAA